MNTSRYDPAWFKRKQKELGYSNSEMARFLCVTVCHIEHMRAGRRNVNPDKVRLIELELERRLLVNEIQNSG